MTKQVIIGLHLNHDILSQISDKFPIQISFLFLMINLSVFGQIWYYSIVLSTQMFFLQDSYVPCSSSQFTFKFKIEIEFLSPWSKKNNKDGLLSHYNDTIGLLLPFIEYNGYNWWEENIIIFPSWVDAANSNDDLSLRGLIEMDLMMKLQLELKMFIKWYFSYEYLYQ